MPREREACACPVPFEATTSFCDYRKQSQGTQQRIPSRGQAGSFGTRPGAPAPGNHPLCHQVVSYQLSVSRAIARRRMCFATDAASALWVRHAAKSLERRHAKTAKPRERVGRTSAGQAPSLGRETARRSLRRRRPPRFSQRAPAARAISRKDCAALVEDSLASPEAGPEELVDTAFARVYRMRVGGYCASAGTDPVLQRSKRVVGVVSELLPEQRAPAKGTEGSARPGHLHSRYPQRQESLRRRTLADPLARLRNRRSYVRIVPGAQV